MVGDPLYRNIQKRLDARLDADLFERCTVDLRRPIRESSRSAEGTTLAWTVRSRSLWDRPSTWSPPPASMFRAISDESWAHIGGQAGRRARRSWPHLDHSSHPGAAILPSVPANSASRSGSSETCVFANAIEEPRESSTALSFNPDKHDPPSLNPARPPHRASPEPGKPAKHPRSVFRIETDVTAQALYILSTVDAGGSAIVFLDNEDFFLLQIFQQANVMRGYQQLSTPRIAFAGSEPAEDLPQHVDMQSTVDLVQNRHSGHVQSEPDKRKETHQMSSPLGLVTQDHRCIQPGVVEPDGPTARRRRRSPCFRSPGRSAGSGPRPIAWRPHWPPAQPMTVGVSGAAASLPPMLLAPASESLKKAANRLATGTLTRASVAIADRLGSNPFSLSSRAVRPNSRDT